MKTITLAEFIDNFQGPDYDEIVVIGSPEVAKQVQARMLLRHAKIMMMMYKQLSDIRYARQAKIDIHRAKSILRSGFVRPLGALLNEVA